MVQKNQRREKIIRERPLLLICVLFLMGNLYAASGCWIYPVGLILGLIVFWISSGNCNMRVKVARGILLLTAFIVSYSLYKTAYRNREAYMDTVKDGEPVTVWGHVYKKEFQNNQFIIYLDKCSFEQDQGIRNCNHLIIYSKTEDFSIGDTVKLYGQVKIWQEARNEGGFDRRQFYYAQKIDFGVECRRVLGQKQGRYKFGEYLYEFRRQMVGVLSREIQPPNAGVLEAMLYGDKNEMDQQIKSLYLATGIAHVLSISGLHISIIGMGIYKLLRKMRLSFAGAAVVAVVLSLFYGQMTGMSIPTCRAVGMLAIALFAQIVGRSNDLLNTLGAVVTFMMLNNPFILGYSGLWFAIMAIVGICYIGQRLQEIILSQDTDIGPWRKKLVNNCIASAGIQLATIPVVAYYYYEIPVYAVLVNLVILPVLTIVIVLGMLGSLVGLVSIKAGSIIVYPAGMILDIYTEICRVVAEMPFSQLVVGRPSVTKLLIYYLSLVSMLELAVIWKSRYKQSGKEKVGKNLKTPGILSVIVMGMLIGYMLTPGKRRFEIDFLDVGQGDCAYICTSRGLQFMVDGGSTSEKNLAKYTLIPFLKYKGVRRVDGWIVSHPDEDHINGIAQVIESGIRVDCLIMSEYAYRDPGMDELLDLADQYEINIMIAEAGKNISDSGSKISFLGPLGDEKDRNDACLVFKLEDKKGSAMFAGDISEEVEKKLVEQYGTRPGGMLDVDVYKVNHHGSNYSSCKEWLNALSPKIAIISCSKHNNYGHPGRKTVLRLKDEAIQILYTMNDGEIRQLN